MKNFKKNKDEIKEILKNWEGSEGCITTDRITVDGEKIGFCYREEPESLDFPDSGWRFFAGDEDDDYINNSNNLEIYSLNTICNYDEDILDILNSPYFTAFEKDKNGKFKIVEDYFQD